MAAFTMCFGPADRLLAGLAELTGRPADADDHFRAALELAERSGSPLWTAEVLFDWAAVRPRPGRAPAGDRAGAAGEPARRTDRLPPAAAPGRPRCRRAAVARRALGARSRGAAVRRQRDVEPRGRRPPVHQLEHRRQPHPGDPAQDRVREPHRGDHLRPSHRRHLGRTTRRVIARTARAGSPGRALSTVRPHAVALRHRHRGHLDRRRDLRRPHRRRVVDRAGTERWLRRRRADAGAAGRGRRPRSARPLAHRPLPRPGRRGTGPGRRAHGAHRPARAVPHGTPVPG